LAEGCGGPGAFGGEASQHARNPATARPRGAKQVCGCGDSPKKIKC